MTVRPVILIGAASLAMLVGCSSSTTSPGNGGGGTATNADELAAIVANDPAADPGSAGYDGSDAVLEAASYRQAGVSPLDAGAAAADTCWFRQLTSSVPSHSVTGDTTAMTIVLTRVNTGVLHVGGCPSPASSPFFTKNYTVSWTRAGVYAKGPVVDPANGEEDASSVTPWRLISASLPHSLLNAGDPAIDSVRVSNVSGTISRTYTDPTAMMSPQNWPEFALGDSVRVQLYTRSSPVMAFMHFDINSGVHARLERRRMLRLVPGGPYTSGFMVRHGYFARRPRGWRVRQALWVDLLTRATLRDPIGAYAASGWGVPYRLHHP